jgi:hypothetical protein
MLLVQTNGFNLRSLDAKQQTEELCLAAVQQNSDVLELLAGTSNPMYFRFVNM